jgi:signal transduction histidine kinase
VSDPQAFSFPDYPRGELDRALDELVDRAKGVLATQGRLRALLRANQAVVEHRDLPVVLRRIVESAVELVGAQYGALGVVSPHGGLEQFITVGMSDAQAAHIGHLPAGHGLLGALIDDPRNIRLPRLADDPRSIGFPAGHPSMDSFLGVPITVRGVVYGNLYLSNQVQGEFSDDDEQLVTALAATAGIAIENARLFAETLRRQAWSAASAEVTSTLLSAETGDSISTVVTRVLDLAEADIVWMLLPTGAAGDYTIERARGLDGPTVEGTTLAAPTAGLGAMLEEHHPRLVDDAGTTAVVLADGRRIGPMMVVPLGGAATAGGVLLVGRLADARRFSPADLEMAADFAGQASIALTLAAARAYRARMDLLEDRGRIARDLHDHVIQRLFATGLDLHRVATMSGSTDIATDIMAAVGSIDASIAQIRTAIFALSVRDDESRESMRHRLIDLVNEVSGALPSTPAVSFAGPVDLMVTDDLASDLIAVAREGLSNIARHASARSSAIQLAVGDGGVRLVITDDGVGMTGTARRSGIANLEARAVRRGGDLMVDSGPTGTTLTWRVPFDAWDADTWDAAEPVHA